MHNKRMIQYTFITILFLSTFIRYTSCQNAANPAPEQNAQSPQTTPKDKFIDYKTIECYDYECGAETEHEHCREVEVEKYITKECKQCVTIHKTTSHGYNTYYRGCYTAKLYPNGCTTHRSKGIVYTCYCWHDLCNKTDKIRQHQAMIGGILLLLAIITRIAEENM